MSDSIDPVKSRNRRMLLLLAAFFFVPVATSFVLYYGFNWRPSGGTNHGELLQPIRQMPASAESLLGKWTLFYVGDGACAEDCRHALWLARQTRLALNKDMPRIGRALFATRNCCDRDFLGKEHEDLRVFDISEPAAKEALLGLLPAGDHANDLFIADPLGNIVLRFDVRTDPRGLMDDLKKLLKLSHIG
jgi:hypothetical protein